MQNTPSFSHAPLLVCRGDKGALHFKLESSNTEPLESLESTNVVEVTTAGSSNILHLRHCYSNLRDSESRLSQDAMHDRQYTIRSTGVLKSTDIVDTTGSGDAFIGGYLLAVLSSSNQSYEARTDFALQFATWVAGKKLGGPGARSALPRVHDVNEELGKDVDTVIAKLQQLVSPFRDFPALVQ